MSPKPESDFDLEDDESPHSERIRRAHEDRNQARRKLSRKREKRSETLVGASGTDNVPDGESFDGIIFRTEGAHFIVQKTDDPLRPGQERDEAQAPDEIRVQSYKGTTTENPNSTLAAVGDKVKVRVLQDRDSVIEHVYLRKTKLSRKAAGRNDDFEQIIVANIDLLVIVASADEPPLRTGIIDRYIVAGLDGGLDIAIVVNKIDLATGEDLQAKVEHVLSIYRDLGYSALAVSSVEDNGLEPLREVLSGKKSVFAGHSGVGKSSIVNALLGSEVGRTGRLSKKYKRGAHTTSGATILPLLGSPNSYIVDTPGVREFANYAPDPQNLKFFFVEFGKYQVNCRVPNCTHTHEPGCAVLEATEDELIDIDRYANYVKLFEEAEKDERKRIEG